MSSRKRWQDKYAVGNPFGLPQNIVRNVRACAREQGENGQTRIKYLWAYVSEDGLRSAGSAQRLQKDEWLSIVDESAAMGAEYIFLSVGAKLSDHPEVVEICQWAQNSHEMTVGVHLYQPAMDEADWNMIDQFDRSSTRIFADEHLMSEMSKARDMGFTVMPADGQHQEVVSPACSLPEKMTCVGAGGTMYTCGLVLGEEDYRFGHVFDRKLDEVMEDDSLPHRIPEGVPKKRHHCNGCPPLMVERMLERREAG